MILRYKVAAAAIQKTQNTTMSYLTIGKEVHSILIINIPDARVSQHLKARGFEQISNTLKFKIGNRPISDLVYTMLSQIPMKTSSAFDKADKVRKKVTSGATVPSNLFGVSFLRFKLSMYTKKIPVTEKRFRMVLRTFVSTSTWMENYMML